MIDYRLLNDSHIEKVQRQKLAEIETEHARLVLDLRLAALSGIENENVQSGRDQLAILEVQHAALCSWLGMSLPEESVEVEDT